MSYKILNNKTVLDYNKLKVFGFQRSNLLYNYYDPENIKYLYSKKYGKFNMPYKQGYRDIRLVVHKSRQADEYQRMFSNANNIRPTITFNFPKNDKSEDLQNFNIFLLQSNKRYKTNQLKFMVDMKYSKIEIAQILNKLYNIKAERITTAILPGKVTTKKEKDVQKREFIRTPDKKVAVVDLNQPVDKYFRKFFSRDLIDKQNKLEEKRDGKHKQKKKNNQEEEEEEEEEENNDDDEKNEFILSKKAISSFIPSKKKNILNIKSLVKKISAQK